MYRKHSLLNASDTFLLQEPEMDAKRAKWVRRLMNTTYLGVLAVCNFLFTIFLIS